MSDEPKRPTAVEYKEKKCYKKIIISNVEKHGQGKESHDNLKQPGVAREVFNANKNVLVAASDKNHTQSTKTQEKLDNAREYYISSSTMGAPLSASTNCTVEVISLLEG